MEQNILNMTDEERQGVAMIQALQAHVGMIELESVSLANWRAMSDQEKAQTQWAYDFFILER